MIDDETFSLKTRDDVHKFEVMAQKYMTDRASMPLTHINLIQAFDYCSRYKNNEKLFAAIFDIYVNFILIFSDLTSSGGIWNNNFSKGKLEGGTILDSYEKFQGKLDKHRYDTSFIFRYRAIWDKLMGFIVLLAVPEQYEKFNNDLSKKKAFKKIKFSDGFLPDGFQKLIIDHLQDFDDKFRTAEAHGTGRLRKWSFSMQSMDKNPSIELMGYWNVLNSFMRDTGNFFNPSDKPSEKSLIIVDTLRSTNLPTNQFNE